MASDIIAPADGALGPVDRPRHGEILRQAGALLKTRKQWEAAISVAYDAAELVERDSAGDSIVLKGKLADDDKFFLGVEVDEHLDKLPPNEVIRPVLDQVEGVLSVKPAPQDYHLLIGIMLDAMFIKAGDDVDGYIDGIGYLLEDVPIPKDERKADPPRWIPIPALAAAIEELLRTYRATYGKPPPIADVIERCAHYRIQLTRFRNQMVTVWNTRQRLIGINQALDAMEDIAIEGDDCGPVDGDDWF